jgi:hypothetical protein
MKTDVWYLAKILRWIISTKAGFKLGSAGKCNRTSTTRPTTNPLWFSNRYIVLNSITHSNISKHKVWILSLQTYVFDILICSSWQMIVFTIPSQSHSGGQRWVYLYGKIRRSTGLDQRHDVDEELLSDFIISVITRLY